MFAGWAAGLHLPDGITPDDIGVLMGGATIGIHLQWRIAPDLIDLRHACLSLEALLHSAVTPTEMPA